MDAPSDFLYRFNEAQEQFKVMISHQVDEFFAPFLTELTPKEMTKEKTTQTESRPLPVAAKQVISTATSPAYVLQPIIVPQSGNIAAAPSKPSMAFGLVGSGIQNVGPGIGKQPMSKPAVVEQSSPRDRPIPNEVHSDSECECINCQEYNYQRIMRKYNQQKPPAQPVSTVPSSIPSTSKAQEPVANKPKDCQDDGGDGNSKRVKEESLDNAPDTPIPKKQRTTQCKVTVSPSEAKKITTRDKNLFNCVHDFKIHLIECNICSYKCHSLVRHEEHLLANHKQKRFHCVLGCPPSASSVEIEELLKHIEKKHGPPPYKCTNCGYQFDDYFELFFHIKDRHYPLKLVCNKCPFVARYRYDAMKHSRVHMPPSPAKIPDPPAPPQKETLDSVKVPPLSDSLSTVPSPSQEPCFSPPMAFSPTLDAPMLDAPMLDAPMLDAPVSDALSPSPCPSPTLSMVYRFY